MASPIATTWMGSESRPTFGSFSPCMRAEGWAKTTPILSYATVLQDRKVFFTPVFPPSAPGLARKVVANIIWMQVGRAGVGAIQARRSRDPLIKSRKHARRTRTTRDFSWYDFRGASVRKFLTLSDCRY